MGSAEGIGGGGGDGGDDDEELRFQVEKLRRQLKVRMRGNVASRLAGAGLEWRVECRVCV
jgi:hypothetical protein